MGSGMLPPGAYVTLEHEYILILRKGSIRSFQKETEKENRRSSAFFWEERNDWYSDVWMDLKGTTQKLRNENLRLRSGAFPFELAYRLINMFSVKGDTVLDPFCGLATSTLAAMAASRNSIGFELEENFREAIHARIETVLEISNARIRSRIENHLKFVTERQKNGKLLKHENQVYGFPVMTRQERTLFINPLLQVENTGENSFCVYYAVKPEEAVSADVFSTESPKERLVGAPSRTGKKRTGAPLQQSLFD
jgi:hypothetical protein